MSSPKGFIRLTVKVAILFTVICLALGVGLVIAARIIAYNY